MAMARVGLVLGAGGVVGSAFHAGVLSALADHTGWDARRAEVIVGTSAGSGTGALLRAGMPAADLAAEALGTRLSPEGARVMARAAAAAARAEARAVPLRPLLARVPLRPQVTAPGMLARAARRPWDARFGLLASALLPAGTVPTEMISAGMVPLFPEGWPSAELWVVAVRLSTGERVVFGTPSAPPARVADAVAASCAIPGFFEPVVIEGHRYVDGGAHSPTNADLVADGAYDVVVVSSPMSRAGRTMSARISPVRQWARRELDREVRRVTRAGAAVVAFQPTSADLAVMGFNAMDTGRRAAVTAQAQDSTRRWLDDPRNAGAAALLRA